MTCLNQETAVYQYHAGVTASPSDPSSDYDETSYTYTATGNPATVKDSAGNQWSFGYDLLGDQTSQTLPDSGTTTGTYDDAQQLMSQTNADGKTSSYTYDADGRKTAEYDTTGGALETSSDEIASWTYDTLAKGLPTSSTSYSGGAAYTEEVTGYNSQGLAEGNQTVIPTAQGALAGTYTQTYTYAPSGQQLSYTDSAAGGLQAETVTTGYNSAGNPDSLTGTTSYVDSLSYTGLGQSQEYTLGTSSDPAYVTDSYNTQTGDIAQQQLQTGTSATTVDDLNYSYDADGLITSEADTPSGATSDSDTQCFNYDYLSRLSQAWAQGSGSCVTSPISANEGGSGPYLEQYTYNVENDLTGITSTSASGAVTTTSLGYPSAGSSNPHAVTSTTTTAPSGTSTATYGYDADGDLTSVTSSAADQALTWSDNGKLTQIAVTPSGSNTAQDSGFVYDASGNQLVRTDPGAVTLYLSDEELVLSTSTGTVTGTRFYTIGSQQIAEQTSSGTGSTDISFLVGDSQGTETVTVDASTLDVTRRWYDPYGNPVGQSGAGFPDGEKGFVGGTADTATGLSNLGAREYESATGSFISTDSELKLSDPQDLNPYAYALDDPATNSDPTGTSPEGAPSIIGGAQNVTAKATYGPYNTDYGVITIEADESLSAPPTSGDSIVSLTVSPNDAVTTVSIPGGGSVTYDDSLKGSVDAIANAATAIPGQEVNAEVNGGDDGNDVWADNTTLWSNDGGDNSATMTASFTQITITDTSTRTVGKGKNQAVLAIDAFITLQVNVHKPNLPDVPGTLEKQMAYAVAEGVLAASAGLLWVVLGTAVEVAAPALVVAVA